MAIMIYQEVATGRKPWAESTSLTTLRNLASGAWVLFDATPADPPPAPDGLDAAAAALLGNPASLLGAAGRAAFVPREEYEAGGGAGGPGGYVHSQDSPSASWSISNPLGRLPVVDLYVAGQQVEADVEATTNSVSVVFPTPTAGIAVLA